MIKKILMLFSFCSLFATARADHSTVSFTDGPRTITAEVDTQIIKPSNNPSYAGNTSYGDQIQDVHVHFSGPVDGNQYSYTVAGFGGTYGMPYTDIHGVFYNFQTDGYYHGRSVVHLPPTFTITVPGFANATITNPTPTGANPASVTINIPKGAIPNYMANANGTVDMAIVQNGVAVQTLTIPAGLAVSVDNGTANFTNLTSYEPSKIAIVAHGYTQGPSGMTFTGNQSDGAYIYVPITQNGTTSTTYTPDGTGTPTLKIDPSLFYQVKPNPTASTGGVNAGSTSQPIWISPSTYKGNYTNSGDTLSNEIYMQGAAQQMQQSADALAQSKQSNTLLQAIVNNTATIVNNTANLSGGGGGGNVTGNVNATVDFTSVNANLTAINATVGNFTAQVDAANSSNLTASSQSANVGILSSAILSPLPAQTFTNITVPSGSASNLTIPFNVPGFISYIDVDPAHAAQVPTIASWCRTTLAFFVILWFMTWCWDDLKTTVAQCASAQQTHGNAVVAGTGAQATTLANAVAIAAAMVVIGTIVSAMFFDFAVSLGVSALPANPFSSAPALLLYFANFFLPLGTIVATSILRVIWKAASLPVLVAVVATKIFAIG